MSQRYSNNRHQGRAPLQPQIPDPSRIRKPKVAATSVHELLTLEDDFDIRHRRLESLSLSGSIAANGSIVATRIRAVDLRNSQLPAIAMTDVVVEEVIAANALWPDCSLMRCEVSESDFVGSDLSSASFQHVRFVGCRFDLANLRFLRAEHVSFERCTFRSADLQGAKLQGAILDRCDLEGAELSKADFVRADMRGSRLVNLRGISGLAGSLVAFSQVIDLAPELAHALGLQVLNDMND